MKWASWNFLTNWSFSFWFIPLTHVTIEVWSAGVSKVWFKPVTALKCETLFYIWSEKLLFFTAFGPDTNLSTCDLIKVDDDEDIAFVE